MGISENSKYNLIVITGPTASGKTAFAVQLARTLGGEIISADSRQVYRGMDIGTGKDLDEYGSGEESIPYHLIDIEEPGEVYNLFRFQKDFFNAWHDIFGRGKFPILCGGTGMYIESVLREFKLMDVPVNDSLRKRLENKSLEDLKEILSGYKDLHNNTDTDTVRRAVRAIEIAEYTEQNPSAQIDFPRINALVIGVNIDRNARRRKISQRLKFRLQNGMVEEVQSLLEKGVSADSLLSYGLEYRYITQFLTGEIDRKTMEEKLEIAIHQFAKRQMTWFRGMEKRGVVIHWTDAFEPINERVERVIKLFKN